MSITFMNTKNTGIQSVQADQIGRTYPPLFTLEELYNHSDQYVNYLHGMKREVLKEAEQYSENASAVYCG